MASCPPKRQSRGRDDDGPSPTTPRRSKKTKTDATEESDEGKTSRGKVRLRVTRACNECRRRKDRCDGIRPSCNSCLSIGRSCSYGPAKKRGLRTGYVRALELLLGMIVNTIDDADDWLAAILDGEERRPKFGLQDLSLLISSKTDVTDTLAESWRTSTTSKTVERLLSVDEPAESLEDGEAFKKFESGIREATKLAAKFSADQIPNVDNGPDMITPAYTNASQPDYSPTGTITLSKQDIDSTLSLYSHQPTFPQNALVMPQVPTPQRHTSPPQIPPNWAELLDVYFANTHSWLPVVQKHDLMRLVYLKANNDKDANTSNAIHSGDPCFLWTVMAYSLRQSGSLELSKAFLESATDILAKDNGKYEIGHIRAILIVALIRLEEQDIGAAWLAIGQATYSAAMSFLTVISDGPLQKDEGTRRTLMCVFVLDTLIASLAKSRPYLDSSDAQRFGLLVTESMEEWEPWHSKDLDDQAQPPSHTPGLTLSTFNSFFLLVSILNDIVRLEMRRDNIGRYYHIIRDFEEWRERRLPDHGNQHDVANTPQDTNLRLACASISETLTTQGQRLEGTPYGVPSKGPPEMLVQEQSLLQLLDTTKTFRMPPTSIAFLNSLEAAYEYRMNSIQGLGGSLGDLQSLKTALADAQKRISRRHSPPTTSRSEIAESEPAVMEAIAESTSAHQSDLRQFQPEAQVSFSELMDTATENISGELFMSLADLDSADWSANPPEFMRHLGVVGDMATDIQSFFDQEPG
ncbi:hypothetical protein CTAM01_08993 [Colletotrichum tamarilloi]|uniref:Zn(2)-C6 fungal-type domain-containing protein n=1 Tax=Colletotrichum tamarilloi TaxID=1209934 RepID=A0ABQ9R4U9_9PEZI|nr:uncharacterized protein CTAM01_08993 [Colletotrichum tamarilloi]KAK1494639.1 hypothetical protein CTAM01_08993 [Colletotrichum tamarilloi]